MPTYLPYFCSARYANITIFFFWPYCILQNEMTHCTQSKGVMNFPFGTEM